MKNIVVVGGLVILAILGYMIGARPKSDNTKDATYTNTSPEQSGYDFSSMLRGRVMSISGEELVLGTFAQREQSSFDRESVQSMSESERASFMAERRAEREAEGEPEITGEKIIIITESTEFFRGTVGAGGAGFSNGDRERSEGEKIQRTDVEEGLTVNIVLKEGTLEAESVTIQSR